MPILIFLKYLIEHKFVISFIRLTEKHFYLIRIRFDLIFTALSIVVGKVSSRRPEPAEKNQKKFKKLTDVSQTKL